MDSMLTLMRRPWLMLAVAALGLGAVSCSDDSTGPDPNAGKTARVTVMHAQIDENPSKVNFMYTTTQIATEVAYGETRAADLQIGSNITVKATGLSGTELANASAKVDSSTATWFVYSGSGTGSEAFAVATPKRTIGVGQAGVRMIHASPGAPKVEMHLLSADGAVVGAAVEYKRGSTEFTPVQITTPTVVITQEDDTELVPLNVTLEEGKLYTVVVYGNSNSNATSNQLTAKLVAEP